MQQFDNFLKEIESTFGGLDEQLYFTCVIELLINGGINLDFNIWSSCESVVLNKRLFSPSITSFDHVVNE